MKLPEQSTLRKSNRRWWISGVVAALMIPALLVAAFAYDQFAVVGNEDLDVLESAKIVISKSERKLELFDGDELIKTYEIALGFEPVGDKEIEGDGKTPEGEFYIFTKNPKSRFYLSLGVSYPSTDDAKRGLDAGVITQEEHDAIIEAIKNKLTPPQKTALGGEIYIHGSGNATDWTAGCIAMKNSDMKELYDLVGKGATVVIKS